VNNRLPLFGFAVPEGTPYRNPVEVNKIQSCIIKALHTQQEICPKPDPQAELKPRMWIITPTLAANKLETFSAVADEDTWGKGIYLLPNSLQTGIIIIHQLPVTPETMLFQLMGKGRVRQTAMAEVAAIPADHPYRTSLLDLLISYRMELATKQDSDPEEQELVMQLSPLYLEQLKVTRLQGELKGQQEMVLQLLNRQVGKMPVNLQDQVYLLTIPQLKSLGEALLDFEQMSDLLAWMQSNT
jgi:Domain of unknown function (DUF4351)